MNRRNPGIVGFPFPAPAGEGRVGTREVHAATLATLLALLAPSTHAFEIERSAARYADRQYQFELIALLDAPPEEVAAVLRDYQAYPSLDKRILEAQVLERPAENVAVLATSLRVCFGPFCRTVRRVERVEESPLAFAAFADAERSDVRFGETHTLLSAADSGTRVRYSTAVTPGFWLPPFVRRRWMLSTLSEATIELFRNVEVRAAAAQERVH